jgi:(2R)-3-sulfolactate dehydrogenase (NADP+)
MTPVSITDLSERVARALLASDASRVMAQSTAQALVLAEAQGIGSTGLSRVPQYIAHLRCGRVDGHA